MTAVRCAALMPSVFSRYVSRPPSASMLSKAACRKSACAHEEHAPDVFRHRQQRMMDVGEAELRIVTSAQELLRNRPRRSSAGSLRSPSLATHRVHAAARRSRRQCDPCPPRSGRRAALSRSRCSRTCRACAQPSTWAARDTSRSSNRTCPPPCTDAAPRIRGSSAGRCRHPSAGAWAAADLRRAARRSARARVLRRGADRRSRVRRGSCSAS